MSECCSVVGCVRGVVMRGFCRAHYLKDLQAGGGRRLAGTSGYYLHPLFKAWRAMLARCTNPRHPSYSDYGGRGIAVCERWLEFPNFLADMGEKPTPGHSLDRIDVSKGYSPENCRWASTLEQIHNRRNSLRPEQQDAIQRLYAAGGSPASIALEVGVRPSRVAGVIRLVCESGKVQPRSDMTCAESGCANVHEARGYCRPHYQAIWRAEQAAKAEPKKPCSITACASPQMKNGLCRSHYMRAIAPAVEKKICSHEGCRSEMSALGLCVKHYHRKLNADKRAALKSEREAAIGGPVMCTWGGCEKTAYGIKFCRSHARQVTADVKMAARGPCSVDGCDEWSTGPHGWCTRHWKQDHYRRNKAAKTSTADC